MDRNSFANRLTCSLGRRDEFVRASRARLRSEFFFRLEAPPPGASIENVARRHEIYAFAWINLGRSPFAAVHRPVAKAAAPRPIPRLTEFRSPLLGCARVPSRRTTERSWWRHRPRNSWSRRGWVGCHPRYCLSLILNLQDEEFDGLVDPVCALMYLCMQLTQDILYQISVYNTNLIITIITIILCIV